MTPKKDEYMRGYGDGFKDGAAEATAMLKAILVHGELACVDAGGHSWGSSGKKPPSKDVFQFPRHMLTDIEVAISKAV